MQKDKSSYSQNRMHTFSSKSTDARKQSTNTQLNQQLRKEHKTSVHASMNIHITVYMYVSSRTGAYIYIYICRYRWINVYTCKFYMSLK